MDIFDLADKVIKERGIVPLEPARLSDVDAAELADFILNLVKIYPDILR